jgi:signal transduction histidine kinase
LSGLEQQRANAVVAIAALVAAVVLVLLGVQLRGSQDSARENLLSRFRDRAQIMSALTQSVLGSATASGQATREYSSAIVSSKLLARDVAQGHLVYAALLDQRGRVIGTSRTLTSDERAGLLGSRALRPVLAGSPASFSDVLPDGRGGPGVIDLAVSLNSTAGRRVLVSGISTTALGAFLSSYLRRVPTTGGRAYVLDSRGLALGASDPRESVGQRVGDVALIHAAQRGSGGPYGSSRYFVAVGVPNSTWRVVLTSSDSALFGSIGGARKWLPWIIYVALGLVALGFILVLGRLLGIAAALSAANSRLEDSNARLESSNALLRDAAELSRSNAELEQFASIASHDLQEPLRKVQTFAAQLNATESERLSDEGQDYLRRMSDAAARMRSLIDDLLMFSRVSTQGRPFTTVDLEETVEQVLIDLEVSIQESGAHVAIDGLPSLQADPVQMRQLMQNLIGNALKFRREGVVPELRVSARLDDHVAELTVKDNGIGFDEQYATRIFRAFERLHGARAYPGTGIGLALCRKIVERHGGTITATGDLGAGAAFTIRLPLEHASETPAVTSLFPEPTNDPISHALV